MTDRHAEPPTPLRSNADFRSFLAATPRIHNLSAKPAAVAGSEAAQPQKSSKRQEHSQRYFAKQAARQVESGKDGAAPAATSQATGRSGHGRQHYRDRAKERRADAGQSEEAEALATAAADEASSKFLGGDVEHTHLVKGLDVALLQRTREEEERREQDRLDELARQLSERKEDDSVNTSKPPTFRTPLAQSVWEWLHPPPVVPSELFRSDRMTYTFPLPPRPSRFAQLPLAVAATVDAREAVSALYPSLASLTELPVSVLTAREDWTDNKDDEVSGSVPPRVLQLVRAAMERKALRKARRSEQPPTDMPQVERKGEAKACVASEVVERKESVEERRRRLMEQDDDDIFADHAQPATSPLPSQAAVASASAIAPSAVFPAAAPTSKYFTTPAVSLTEPARVTPPLASLPVAPSHALPLPASPAARAEQPATDAAPSAPSRQASAGAEEDEDEEYLGMSFSANFAGDDDSDDELVRRQDKEEARQQRLQAKRGRGGRAGGKRERAQDKSEDRAEAERKRDAKLEQQLAGVNELLKKDGSKLSLDAFEKESSRPQSKRLKYG